MDKDQRASRAKSILEDGVFLDAISVVKEYHTATFLKPNAEAEEVMEARRMVLALTEVVNELVSFMTDGELAKHKRDKHRG